MRWRGGGSEKGCARIRPQVTSPNEFYFLSNQRVLCMDGVAKQAELKSTFADIWQRVSREELSAVKPVR